MSAGKVAAQASHAAVRAALSSERQNAGGVANWLKNGETKIVLEARDHEHLATAQRYIENRSFGTHLIIDEGRTEIAPLSVTALGVELLDKADPYVQATFETFSLYGTAAKRAEAVDELNFQKTLDASDKRFWSHR